MTILKQGEQILTATELVSDTKSLNKMLSRLPSRYGSLLIDKITYFQPDNILVCLKNVTRNENVFFKDNKYYPSLHILEALVQACSIIATYPTIDQPYSADFNLLNEIKSAIFHKPVIAGDQLLITVTVMQKKPYRWEMEATASTEEGLASSAHIFFTKEGCPLDLYS